MSKLFSYPEFPAIIKSHLADVNENIDNFLANNTNMELLIYDPECGYAYKGYRFITQHDQKKEEWRTIKISKVDFQVKFTRLVSHSKDRLCPLWYTLDRIDVEIFFGEISHVYKNDSQLKKFISKVKKCQP